MRNLLSMLRSHEPPPVEEKAPEVSEIRSAHPSGHFYSPVVDADELPPGMDRLWPSGADDVADVNIVVAPIFNFAQRRLLRLETSCTDCAVPT